MHFVLVRGANVGLFFAYGYLTVLAPFVEKATLSSLNRLCALSRIRTPRIYV